jgi:hypothetical protein
VSFKAGLTSSKFNEIDDIMQYNHHYHPPKQGGVGLHEHHLENQRLFKVMILV